MRVLITGGAGYIGSHCAAHLGHEGADVVILDDLSAGHRWAVRGPLVLGSVCDERLLRDVLDTGFDAVLHLAARVSIGRSWTDPIDTWSVNTGGTLAVARAVARSSCRVLVFSSTAAVYGHPQVARIPESHPRLPLSPYGRSKLAAEDLLEDLRADGLRVARLRFFNAAGASPDGTLGEAHDPETHLVPLALEAARSGTPLPLLGEDYPTPDGTPIRDYVHVQDLAAAHRLAVTALLDGHPGAAWNVGTGSGASVREVLASVSRATGSPVHTELHPRRPGDAARLVADGTRIRTELGWEPRYTLDDAVETAWRWMLSR